VKVTIWGTRGSIAAPGPDTLRYGGNTSCIQVEGPDGTVLVLDAGSGIRRLGARLVGAKRIDVLLTHLHMDHIQGLGFFAPLYVKGLEVHLWGPASTTLDLRTRLTRYLSPPLFPVLLRDLACHLEIHEIPRATIEIGSFSVRSELVCHPGPTVGYRIGSAGKSLAYLPDHEPALGARSFPLGPRWTSGHDLAAGADLLVHDAQYTESEYPAHVGWGHSSLGHAIAFAAQAGARHLVPFHHDPARDDDALEAVVHRELERAKPSFPVTPAAEGTSYNLS